MGALGVGWLASRGYLRRVDVMRMSGVGCGGVGVWGVGPGTCEQKKVLTSRDRFG